MNLLDRIAADKQRDESHWFQVRASGVTATDIAALERGGPAKWQALLSEKRSQNRTFHGNDITAWGLEREQVIGEWMRAEFGHEPSDATFHAIDNPRFLATPDGIQITDDFITIAEIKTSKYDLEPGSEAFLKSHYMAQMQWQMMVAGDDVMECLFIWEVREGESGSFTPGKRGHAWIERDNGHISELISMAERFLADLDSDEVDSPDDYIELVTEWTRIKDSIREREADLYRVEEQIRDRIGQRDSFHIETPAGKVTLSPSKVAERFDTPRFKTEHPDIWREYVKQSPVKPALRVTPVKVGDSNDVF